MQRKIVAIISTLGAVIAVSLGAAGAQAAPARTAGAAVLAGSGPSADPAAQTNGKALFLGTTTPVGLSAATRAPLGRGSSAPSERGFRKHASAAKASARANPKAANLTPPSPAGTPVSASPGGAVGFNGVSHLTQLQAGTGVYAGTQGSLEPPDQALCAGNGFVIESVNLAFAVHNSAGTPLTAVTADNQFFKRSPEIISPGPPEVFGDFLSDPKCYFDPVGHRFIQTILEIDAPGNIDGSNRTHVLVAVSATADPTGTWRLFSFDTSDDGNLGTPAHTGCPCLPDQPLLGANRDGIFIATNEFQLLPGNFPFNGAQIYGFGRRTLEQAGVGDSPGFVQLNVGTVPTGDPNLPFWGSVQPATSPTPQAGTEFLMTGGPEDNFQNNAPLDNRIAAWALTGTSSLDSGHPAVALQHRVLSSEVYGLPVNTGATQKAGPTPLRDALGDTDPLETINGNDSRMNQVVLADGQLLGGVNTTVTSPGGPNRIGIAFFAVSADNHSGRLAAAINRQGYVAVNGENVMFPSIGVTSAGRGAMSITLSGPGFFPSAAFVRFDEHGPAGPIHLAGAGTAPEDGASGYAAFGGNGVARWGDYSAAVADGAGHVWLAGEYIPGGTRSIFANWGTFFSRLQVGG
jgi:hypothetical protein